MGQTDQIYTFFITCPLGFEEVLAHELKLKTQYREYEVKKGGLEIKLGLCAGLELNKILRGATRILMRLKVQKCRDFPKLFKIIKGLPWKKYLVQENALWECSSQKSRIIHTTRMEETSIKAMNEYFKANHLPQKTLELHKDLSPQKIYLRLDQDELTISIDTSGELLHIRGDRMARGHASIRESYASLLLTWCFGQVQHLGEAMVDPMCGTGTFLYEALNYSKLNCKRTFAYQAWPINPIGPQEILLPPIFEFTKYYGFDIDDSLVRDNGESSEFHFGIADIFSSNKIRTAKPADFIICNPPYGKRIKLDRPAREYFPELITSILNKFCPRYLAILVPEQVQIENNYSGYSIKSKIQHYNNSIRLVFYLFEQKISS